LFPGSFCPGFFVQGGSSDTLLLLVLVGGLTAYGVHIHEDLGDDDSGVEHDEDTDDGVQCWTSAFQQTRCPTATSAPSTQTGIYFRHLWRGR